MDNTEVLRTNKYMSYAEKFANFKKESLKLLNRKIVSPTRRALNQH